MQCLQVEQLYDLDFVTDDSLKKIESVLSSLGFEKNKGRHFSHPKSKYFVEFLPAPVAIGDEKIEEENSIIKKGKKLILLSPTYSVMDRLASYFYWDDPQGLEQAIMITKKQDVNFDKIKQWAIKESQKEKLKIFLDRISKL